VGSQYVLINEEYSAGNGALDGKLLTAVDVEISDDIASGDDLCPMTLGGNANGYSLAIGNEYLSTSKAKELKMVATESKIWQIASTTKGYVVKASNTSYGTIQYNYNSGNARFLNYTSNQKPAVLYVKKATSTAIQTVSSYKGMTTNRIYTLDGRYVGTDPNLLPRGLYIINGKKIVK
jgi:hypothetical protein